MNLRRFIVRAVCASAVLSLWLWPGGMQAQPPGVPIIQLTNDRAISVRPALSSDNRAIAFQSNRDGNIFHIHVMNADGSNRRALTKGTTDDRHPVWMPDGKTILFDSYDGTHQEIWMVNVADGSRKQLTHVGGLSNFASPSPDGRRISFYVFKDKELNLWTARMDGSDARPLTRGLAIAENNQCTFACHQAAWSPDGTTLAYPDGDRQSIWTVRSDGSDAKPLIANGELNHFPWFLADGRLGYINEHVNPTQSWTDAWAFDIQRGEATLLQERMSPQGPFEWSADNRKVLFHSPRSGNFEIYMVDLSVPGGVQALQGTPVPAQLAAGAERLAPPAADPSPNAQPIISGNFRLVAALGIVVATTIAAVGVLMWRRVKNT